MSQKPSQNLQTHSMQTHRQNLNATMPKRPSARYKIILLGDEAVGKTSLLSRCVSDVFYSVHEPTVGIDYASMLIQEYNIKLNVWDMACQDRFRCLLPQYIRGSAGIVVMYDVNRRESFLNACRMASYVRDLHFEQIEGQLNQQQEEVLVFLVGNKIDMGHKAREISTSEGEETAARECFEFFECSVRASYPNPRILMNTIAEKLSRRAGVVHTGEDADAAAGAYAVVHSASSSYASDR